MMTGHGGGGNHDGRNGDEKKHDGAQGNGTTNDGGDGGENKAHGVHGGTDSPWVNMWQLRCRELLVHIERY